MRPTWGKYTTFVCSVVLTLPLLAVSAQETCRAADPSSPEAGGPECAGAEQQSRLTQSQRDDQRQPQRGHQPQRRQKCPAQHTPRRRYQSSPAGFHANSSEARGLFQGCRPAAAAHVQAAIRKDAPSLVIIGAQKTGTTSISHMSQGIAGVCFAQREAHFWDQERWSQQPPDEQVLRTEYLTQVWTSCSEGQAWIEKTPSLLNSPSGPFRMCQTLGRQRLMVLLRNPVKRALSGFHQSKKFLSSALRQNVDTPDFFDMYVRIEVALVQTCPTALPTGDPDKDAKRSARFQTCCQTVAKGFIQSPWPGCACRPRGPNDHTCTDFGHIYANAVRRGLYAHYLRIWLRYHEAQDLLIFRAEDFFDRAPEVISEMSCFARSAGECEREDVEEELRCNTRTGGKEMWSSTEQTLKDFYAPYNKELEELLGRQLLW